MNERLRHVNLLVPARQALALMGLGVDRRACRRVIGRGAYRSVIFVLATNRLVRDQCLLANGQQGVYSSYTPIGQYLVTMVSIENELEGDDSEAF